MIRKAFSFILALMLILSLATSAAAESTALRFVVPPEPNVFVPSGVIVAPPNPLALGLPSVSPSVSSVFSNTLTPSAKYPYTTFRSWIAYTKNINSDTVGWLRIPGTNINHPVMQSTHEQGNEYYNIRDLRGNAFPNMTWRNFADTAVFRDVRVISGETWIGTSRNTVIYGHNWTNWRAPYTIGNLERNTLGPLTMFAQLPSYTSLEFARENPYIYYSDEHKEGIWKVFAVATVEVCDSFDYIRPNPNEEYFQFLINEWKSRSRLNFDVDVSIHDRILTLSTCTNEHPVPGARQRMVIVARLLRAGETENDPVTVTVNPNPKRPVFN